VSASQLWLAQPPPIRLQQAGLIAVRYPEHHLILANLQVILFDTYTLLSENGLVKGEYTLDLLHLNAAGYDALNHALTPLLLQVAQTNASG
jgi:lysophospholipase L1-like esterase